MIPHFSQQIYLSFIQQNDWTPPKCGELSEYTDSAHTEVEDPSSRCMNASNEYDRCGHDTRQFYPSCTAYRRTANLKFVCNRTIPINLQSGKNILADTRFKISIGHSNLAMRQL